MNSNKVRMGRISYINASPVYYGLDNGLVPDWLTLVTDVPTALNRKIKEGEIDISPISSAYYAMNHTELLLLPDFSISCNGNVLSVICASNYSLDELDGKTVMISRESASGASFLKMIFAMKQIDPVFRVGRVGDMNQIPGDVDAVMVIGDAALTQPWEKRFSHRFDLGNVWFEMTGLPFVFAVWVVRKDYARQHPDRVADVIELLEVSRSQGYANMDEVVWAGRTKLDLSASLIRNYFDHLFCDLDDLKIKGMKLFFDSLYEHRILKSPVEINFFKIQP